MEKFSDKYLISRIQDGEISYFALIVDRYKNYLLTLISKIVDNREDAKDILQEVFLTVYKNISKFKGNSSLSTWLYRIAYNASINYIRQNKIAYVELNQNSFDEENVVIIDNEESFDKEVLYQALDKAIIKLSPQDRALMILFYIQDKSIVQCCDILSLSEANIKVKLHRIRKRLSIQISQEINNQDNFSNGHIL